MSDRPAPAFDPKPGAALEIARGLRRILAPNPSAMTFRGTNTYLLGHREIAVIDPGPDDPGHLDAILHALGPGARVTHILVTHAHLDHSALAPRLAHETGAPVLAFGDALAGRSAVMQRLADQGLTRGGEGVDLAFAPDRRLADGETVETGDWRLGAIWTPGHFGNHLCFAWDEAIFTGDLVMGWASSLVSPPDGDAGDFTASCRKLAALGPNVLYPGHGAPVENPAERLDWLIAHRAAREAAILTALAVRPGTAAEIAATIYTDTPAALLPAAARNVLAHLIDLAARGIVAHEGAVNAETVFRANEGE
ncbi:MBL fold metallo-hydrolase [Roseovarius aquimarinus]|uniref:MBL fold metallo-hydrolase n=1 Tax=Roseovarius aquimarinus TaxID=1229156 RepID=A0ABW7I3V4_9RHOB